MAYKIQFRLDDNVLYFEIAGIICRHIDSIATYVRYHIAESGAKRVSLDLRSAAGGFSPAMLFTHVLKYPPMHRIGCAMVDREPCRDFVLLYATLMQHRGHRIRVFANMDEGTAWLLNGCESRPAFERPSSVRYRYIHGGHSLLGACRDQVRAVVRHTEPD